MAFRNSQLDENGELKPAVVHGTRKELDKFPVKRLVEVRDGVETWIIDLSAIKLPWAPVPKPQQRRGGDYTSFIMEK